MQMNYISVSDPICQCQTVCLIERLRRRYLNDLEKGRDGIMLIIDRLSIISKRQSVCIIVAIYNVMLLNI